MKTEQSKFLSRWHEIIKVAWPLIIANSFWNLQVTIDRIFLGHYSTEALGAAMAVMGVFWTPMALLQQTAAYLMTFVAQFYGAKRFDRIGAATWQSIYISVGGGLLLLLMIPLADILFQGIGHAESMRKLEVDYFVGLCFSALPVALTAAASGFFTGLGRTQFIIGINLVGLLANVVFDYIMIFGKFGFPELGIAGAGYATALASWASALYGLWLLFRPSYEREYKVRSNWKLDWDLIQRNIRYGLPSGLQWALEGLAFTVFLIILGRLPEGAAALASSSIVVTVMMLSILPALGVAQAVSVLVGQHLGEQKPQLAEAAVWSGWQLALVYILLMSTSFALFPEFYLNWFRNEGDPGLWAQVSTLVPTLLLFMALFTCFDCTNLIFSFALKGAGDTRFVSLVALILPWPIMVLPTWLAQGQTHAVYWAWTAATVFSVVQAMTFLRRFIGGKWKSMSVIN